MPGVRTHGLAGRDLPRYRVYCSEQAHSSIDKAVIAIGLGHDVAHPRRQWTTTSACGRMRSQSAIAEDRAAGVVPIAVVATVGTTSTTSVDPLARDRGDLRARTDLAARRCGVRGCRGDAARTSPRARRRRAGRLAGRQPAQVAVHAGRPQRVLLPPNGRRPRRVLVDARVPEDRRRGGRRGEEPDGHRHPARPPVPRAEVVDGDALVRRERPT